MKKYLLLLSAILAVGCKRDIVLKDANAGTSARAVTNTTVANPAAFFSGPHQKYVVQSEQTYLLAGSIFAGFTNGHGRDAQFNAPSYVASDADGYIYVSDFANHCIRKMDGGGNVTTYAGTGAAGFQDGATGSALFNGPMGLAFGPDGSLYVADMGNNRIRKISKDGTMVSTVAGSGVAGFADGPGNVAKFNSPWGIAVDPAGVIYVADRGNHRIRRISTTGIVTQWVGDGTPGYKDGAGSLAELNGPMGLSVGIGGVLYVADFGNNRIRKIASGVISTIGDSSFRYPTDVKTDNTGALYIADNGNSVIKKMTPAGVVTTICGSGISGSYDSYDLYAQISPWGLAIGYFGDMYVADRWSNMIRTIMPIGATRTLAGNGVSGYAEGKGKQARFKQPLGIVADKAGNVYVSDYQDNRIRMIAPDGTTSLFAGSGAWAHVDGTGGGASFLNPSGLAIDAAGNIYVYELYAVRKITPSGVVTTVGVTSEYGNLAVDASGYIYATDIYTSYINRINPSTGLSNTQWAKIPDYHYTIGGMSLSGPGEARNITAVPNGVFVSGGVLNTNYLMDFNGNFSAPLPPILPWDQWGPPLNVYLLAQAADSYHSMYFTSSNNNVVGLTAAGLYPFAGDQGYSAGYIDGPNHLARFNRPMGLAFGPGDVMYVADSANHCVRMLSK